MEGGAAHDEHRSVRVVKNGLRDAAAKPLLSVAPFKLKRVALVSTRLPGLAEKVIVSSN